MRNFLTPVATFVTTSNILEKVFFTDVVSDGDMERSKFWGHVDTGEQID